MLILIFNLLLLPIIGNGIFATVAFNRGDFLLEYVEERIDFLEAERREKI